MNRLLHIITSRIYLLLCIFYMTILIVLFCWYSYSVHADIGTPPQLQSFTKSPGWMQYTDPDGYYTIWIPTTWQIHQEKGYDTSTVGEKLISFASIDTTFSNPVSSEKVSVHVNESPSVQRINCVLDKTNNAGNPSTIFDGYPAEYDFTFGWLISTTKGSYQIAWSPQFVDHNIMQAIPTQSLHEYLTSGITIAEQIIDTYRFTEKKIISSLHLTPALPECQNYIL